MALSTSQGDRLCRYAELIEKWNKGMNLVSRKDIGRLDARHLLDSLAAVPWLTGDSVLDIGTGPGLPGIPLAIARPDMTVTLWERMTRRVRFLQLVCRELGLTNVNARVCDFERETSLDKTHAFTNIVARAVAPIEQLWPIMRDHLSSNGRLIVYSRVISETDTGDETRPTRELCEVDGIAIEQLTYLVPGLQQSHRLQRLSVDSSIS